MAVDRRCKIVFGELDNARGIFRHLDGCQRSLSADLRPGILRRPRAGTRAVVTGGAAAKQCRAHRT
jgi:hypothetical protein